MTKAKRNFIYIEALIGIFILISIIAIKYDYIKLIPRCYIFENFNILCPSCGSTRCVINFLQGNIFLAFYYNPIICITIIYLIIVNFIYCINNITNRNILICIYPRWYYIIIWAFILIILAIIRNCLGCELM